MNSVLGILFKRGMLHCKLNGKDHLPNEFPINTNFFKFTVPNLYKKYGDNKYINIVFEAE